MLQINPRITIPENEITYNFSTSSGPGGQNVNKLNTRVTLLFDLKNSTALSQYQKNRIRKKLSPRINKLGQLTVSSQKHRSQHANRNTAREKLADLITHALRRRKPRKKTKPPRSANRRRLENKKQRAQLKKQRQKIDYNH